MSRLGGVVGSEVVPALLEFLGGWVGVEVASGVHALDRSEEVGLVDRAGQCEEVRAIHQGRGGDEDVGR